MKSYIQVSSAFPLTEQQKAKIEKTFLGKYAGKKFVYELDPSLIGGILVVADDIYYDGTIKGQLSELKKTLRT